MDANENIQQAVVSQAWACLHQVHVEKFNLVPRGKIPPPPVLIGLKKLRDGTQVANSVAFFKVVPANMNGQR